MEEVPVDPFTNTLKRVIQVCNATAKLAKGIHEVCKSLESKDSKPKFVVLSKNCDDAAYKKLVEALAKQNGVPILYVDEGETLGEWLGICKYDQKKNIRKKRRCSSLAIKEYPVEIKAEEQKTIEAKLG